MTSTKKAPSLPVLTKLFTKEQLTFLETYINTPSPTWFEYTWQQVRRDYISPFVDETFVDTYGTCVGVINPDAPYKIVIEAHADEISRFVNYISDDGMIYVIRNGWSDHQIAPSKRVNIHTRKDGIKKAVFGRPAIHTRRAARHSGKETAPEVDNIFLDCGCTNKEEVEKLGIKVGDVITYEDKFNILNDRYFIGRAFDNRAGWFMIAQVAALLKKNKKQLPFGLYIVNSVQEEVGLRWAEMIVETIKPNLAIITDVCHDTTTPMIDKHKEWYTVCGKWPVISRAPSIHNKLGWFIEDLAETQNIEIQRLASSSYSWTDTDAFAYANGGCPSSLISLPLRYMHTTVEMVHYHDVYQTIQLIYETVCALKPDMNWKYL